MSFPRMFVPVTSALCNFRSSPSMMPSSSCIHHPFVPCFLAESTQRSHLSCTRRRFSSTSRSQRKHVDHYATLSVPRTATKAQIKTRYYQLSKQYHPDVAKDSASRTKFLAVSEAYAVLGDDRKRREYDRTSGASVQMFYAPGQHPQATTTRPSQQPGFKHFWPNHPRNRTRDPMGSHPNAPRYANPHERARAGNYNTKFESSYAGPDPFTNPFVLRATGRRRSGTGATSQSNRAPPPFREGGFQSAGSAPWASLNDEARRTSAGDGRPTQDEAAAESGVMRALGASGLVGVIMLVAAVVGNSKRTS